MSARHRPPTPQKPREGDADKIENRPGHQVDDNQDDLGRDVNDPGNRIGDQVMPEIEPGAPGTGTPKHRGAL